MTKVYAPNREYRGTVADIQFTNGVADVPKDHPAMGYFIAAGYGIGDKADAPAAPPEPADPRNYANATVGTDLRDAAVDPRPEDYLPPTNAGEANPHGPEVVAPGIHGVGPTPIAPGPVTTVEAAVEANPSVHAQGAPSLEEILARADVQEAIQTRLAEAVLVQGAPADIAATDFDADPEGGNMGPLGLSDPGSAEAGVEAAAIVAQQEAANAPEQPKGNATQAEWRDYALAKGATEDEVADLSRADLIAKYGKG